MENNMTHNIVAVPVYDTVLLPGVEIMLRLQEPANELATYFALGNTSAVAVPLRRNVPQGCPNEEDYYKMGVRLADASVEKNENGTFLSAKLIEKVEIHSLSFHNSMVYAEYRDHPETPDITPAEQEQILTYMKNIIRDFAKQFKGVEQYLGMLDGIKDLNSLVCYLGSYMEISADEKFGLLKTDSLRERSLHFMDLMMKQKEHIELNMELNERVSERSNQYYREQVLREQLRAIQEELGETDGGFDGMGAGTAGKKADDYATRIEEAGMPEEIKAAALEEVDKLKMQQQGSAEESVIRNYLDFLLKLPWKKAPHQDVDLKAAEKILDDDHYGLEKVKQRILQHLAVMQLKKNNKGSILLLVGPPGTGKTSLGRSIARALDREYVRISLGGVRDEAEIRGHRRTYVGAMPGRILNSIKNAGTTNPVMVLDEVDKL
ncbi:MAG: AAA family ATPase, partial [Clostridia bacterium]|nr:AAA family ATPase [Clostridia bacterium]